MKCRTTMVDLTERYTESEREQIMEYSRESAEEFMEDYRDTHGEPVSEKPSMTVFADTHGHELNEWANELGIDREAVSAWHHHMARFEDYEWSTSDPVVLLTD